MVHAVCAVGLVCQELDPQPRAPYLEQDDNFV